MAEPRFQISQEVHVAQDHCGVCKKLEFELQLPPTSSWCSARPAIGQAQSKWKLSAIFSVRRCARRSFTATATGYGCPMFARYESGKRYEIHFRRAAVSPIRRLHAISQPGAILGGFWKAFAGISFQSVHEFNCPACA